jgi:hypothetical protein
MEDGHCSFGVSVLTCAVAKLIKNVLWETGQLQPNLSELYSYKPLDKVISDDVAALRMIGYRTVPVIN